MTSALRRTAERGRALAPAALVLAALAGPWPQERGAEVGRLRAQVEELRAQREQLLAQLDELARELAREREARLAREQEWLRYTQVLAALRPRAELPPFGPQVPTVAVAPAAAPAPTPAEAAAAQRASEILNGLRALLFGEGVHALDLLEVGRLADGGTGPVVFRLLDARGRLTGSLYAERLRLEASRAGRTLTLVLENGYEAHGGERTAFGAADAQGGPAPWRLTLGGLDPEPWIESLEELFGDLPPDTRLDDGRWDLAWVRARLNQLLREDASAGSYRLRRLGGIIEGVLRDVHVEALAPDGALERRLFADRLRLAPATRGVVLVFEDGVQVRGGEKTPFLDGRLRVFLPRARQAVWRADGLPGFVAGPSGAAARDAQR